MSKPIIETASIPNDPGAIARVRTLLSDALGACGYGEASAFAIRLAFEEAIANAFRHGHRDLPPSREIEIEFRIDASEARIAVEDAGPGFSPDDVPDPTLSENLDKPSGRGLMLMRAYMTEVRHSERGRRVEMVYRCDG